MSSRRRRAWAMTLALTVATGGTLVAGPAAAPAGAPGYAPVGSSYEGATLAVSRDGGFSIALPDGLDLWIFGDTGVYRGDPGRMVPTGFVPGSSAAEGPYRAGQVPTALREVPSPGRPLGTGPSGPPAQFIPTATDEYLPDGSGRPCADGPGRYPARWASGAALVPGTSEVLVTYDDVCVTGPTHFTAEGWGFLEYDWRTNAVDVGPVDVFAPQPDGAPLTADLQFKDPVVDGGQVTLFSSVCTDLFVACSAGTVYETTVPDTPAALGDPASYTPQPAVIGSPGAWTPIDLSVAAYPDGTYRMIETTEIDGSYTVLSATGPTGPWLVDGTGKVPGCEGLPSGFCYSLIGHPELSDLSHLMVSYYDPAAGPDGASGPVGHDVAALVGIPDEAGFYGSTGDLVLNRPIVGMAATPDGRGYWLVAADGGIFAFGDAAFSGSAGNLVLHRPVVGMAATPDGRGYWLVAADGGIFAFGDAAFSGSAGDLVLNRPIVGMAAASDGRGYWLVAADGGIFAFGDAAYFRATGPDPLVEPVVGMAAKPDGTGYWAVDSRGDIAGFGDAGFYGSVGGTPLNRPVVGMAATPDGRGYWEVASDGGIF